MRNETSACKGFHSTFAALFSYQGVVVRDRVTSFATHNIDATATTTTTNNNINSNNHDNDNIDIYIYVCNAVSVRSFDAYYACTTYVLECVYIYKYIIKYI